MANVSICNIWNPKPLLLLQIETFKIRRKVRLDL